MRIGTFGTDPGQRRSPVRPAETDAGFTLLELLIVLAIAGMIAALAVPAFRETGIMSTATQAARLVATDLAAARQIAIFENRPVDLLIDVTSMTTRIRDRTPRAITGISNISLVTTRSALQAPSVGSIRFYPDGSADGGALELTDDRGRTARIRVNWLTGRIEIDA